MDYDIKEISIHDGVFTVSMPIASLQDVTQAIKNMGIKVDESQIEWVAKNLIELDAESEEKAFNLLEKIEEYDDVQNVFTNIG